MVIGGVGDPVPGAQRAEGLGGRAIPENPLFSTLSLSERLRVLSGLCHNYFTTGQVITSQGQTVGAVHFIHRGRARAEISNSRSGTPLAIVDFLGPGDDIGLLSVIDGAPHSATVRAMEDVCVTCVEMDVMRGLLSRHPEWYAILAEVAVSRLRTCGLWLERLI